MKQFFQRLYAWATWLQKLVVVLLKLWRWWQSRNYSIRFQLADGTILEGGTSMKLRDTEQVELVALAVDAKGQPAEIENPVWESSDTSVAAVAVDANNPLKATVVAGNVGTARVTLAADAQIGDGEVPINGFIDFEVIAGQAVNLNISAGTPTPQP